MFNDHYHEALPENIAELYEKVETKDSRLKFKKRLADSNATWDGKKLIPVSYLPRILPKSYSKAIERTARLVTETALNAYAEKDLLRRPGLNNLLIEEFGVLDNLQKRIVGSARYDFAVCGEPSRDNPPKLLELNMLDYGGIGWIPGINRSVLDTMEGLSDIVTDINLTGNIASNFRKIGKSLLFIYDEDLSYGDFSNFYSEIKSIGLNITAMSCQEFSNLIKTKKAKLSNDGIYLLERGDKLDFIYMRALSTHKEILDSKELVHAILNNGVPMYDGFASLLLENKSILPLFKNISKDKTLADKVFLESTHLNEDIKHRLLNDPTGTVLKHSDGHFGESVYVGKEIKQALKEITDYEGWCTQEFAKLNTNEVWPLNQNRFSGIVDLAVYVNYIWENERLKNFSVAGYLCRSSKNDFKVNVSRGGCFVPLFFTK